MANNNWNNYTEKTATPVDADEVMVRDSADGKNKKQKSFFCFFLEVGS